MFPKIKVGELLYEINRSFRWINSGGCGFMAEIIAEELGPYLYDVRIVTCGGRGPSLDEVRPLIKNPKNGMEWVNNGIHFSHVWVEAKLTPKGDRYAIDSEGIHPITEQYDEWYKPYDGSFTIKEIKWINETPQVWNSVFSRRQVPAMRKMMHEGVEAIFNNQIGEKHDSNKQAQVG